MSEDLFQREAFTEDQYRRLLDAIQQGGYQSIGFQQDTGEDSVIFLRHDVDQRVDRAERLSDIEAVRDMQATYFFLIRSPLYSVLEPEVLQNIRSIAERGHWIGLHCDVERMTDTMPSTNSFDENVRREVDLFFRMIGNKGPRLVSFHNPEQHLLNRQPPEDRYISAYDDRFMLPETKYISESNAHWREGDPYERIKNQAWPRLQLLTHPVFWSNENQELRITDVLQDTLSRRQQQSCTYLKTSNHVWKEFVE